MLNLVEKMDIKNMAEEYVKQQKIANEIAVISLMRSGEPWFEMMSDDEAEKRLRRILNYYDR